MLKVANPLRSNASFPRAAKGRSRPIFDELWAGECREGTL